LPRAVIRERPLRVSSSVRVGSAFFVRRHDARMKLKLTIAIAVAACLAVFILWVVPQRSISEANTCINYLSQINSAKQQWGLDNHKATNDVPTWDDLVPRYMPKKLKCPIGGTYTIGRLDEFPRCSIPRHILN
jgi:hypothetical protein